MKLKLVCMLLGISIALSGCSGCGEPDYSSFNPAHERETTAYGPTNSDLLNGFK